MKIEGEVCEDRGGECVRIEEEVCEDRGRSV